MTDADVPPPASAAADSAPRLTGRGHGAVRARVARTAAALVAGLLAAALPTATFASPPPPVLSTPTSNDVPADEPTGDDAGVEPATGPGSGDGPFVTGPVVSIDRTEVAPGDEVIVTLAGFESRAVVIVVCGNEGRRGSGDCNMRAARGREIERDSLTTRVNMTIGVPPAPCPCLIRAASSEQAEVAVFPITLTGHPVADPVDPIDPGPLVEATVSAVPVADNPFARLRTALGGATTYRVTVSARNLVTTPIVGLSVSAAVGRDATDVIRSIELDPLPAALDAGQRWQQVVDVELPTPVWGSHEWRFVVSGAGPPIEAVETTSNRPTALFVLVGLLVLDVAVILLRMRRRRRPPRADEPAPRPVIDVDEDGTVWTLDDRPAPAAPGDAPWRRPDPDPQERELIGT